MLTNEQRAVLIRYYQSVELTGEQKDRLVAKYWSANEEERREIALAYARVFAEDGVFMQRLVAYFDLHLRNAGGGDSAVSGGGDGSPAGGRNSPASPATSAGASASHTGTTTSATFAGSPTTSNSSNSGGNDGYTQQRLTHSQRLLRTAIQDRFPKLTGPGPFSLAFGLVHTEAERREVVDLYASQFTAPDPPELLRIVALPQTHSTRTRRRVTGNYTWYLRCLSTQELVCAVTVTAHHHQTHHFVEMPLFATGGGYKRNGFGRLLNAALTAWCVRQNFEYIMISADANAIPFWKHMGYEMMSASEKKKIAFYYENECYSFSGTEPMIGYCTRPRGLQRAPAVSPPPQVEGEVTGDTTTGAANVRTCSLPLYELAVGQVLQQMSKFAIVGSLDLPSDG